MSTVVISFNKDVSDKQFCFIEDGEVFQLVGYVRPATKEEIDERPNRLMADDKRFAWGYCWYGNLGNVISRDNDCEGYLTKKEAVIGALTRCAEDEGLGLREQCEVYMFDTHVEQFNWMAKTIEKLNKKK